LKMLWGKKIILGVTGGIAAYKAVEILRRLTDRGAEVYVVMTKNAEEFVNPLTFQVLSGHRVAQDMWDRGREMEMEHIALAKQADLILITPATANILAKIAHGLADDLLSTICLVSRAPMAVSPSMNDQMFTNAAVQANLNTLRQRGIRIIEPETGYLACEVIGVGRLPSLDTILQEVEEALGITEDLSGRKITITAGPTWEAIDPVRFISNRSSGKMGLALAQRALIRGADVSLILGPTTLDPPPGADCVRVETAREMADAALKAAEGADIFIAAAAVADYTPARPRSAKMKKKKESLKLDLKPTTDILASLGKRPGRPFLIGFAAETGDPVPKGKRKLKSKKADLMVANDVSRPDSAFGADQNEVHLIHAGKVQSLPLLPKEEVADKILDTALLLLS
jgi:phosphopantothenoylcysteine decarboxylase/phosphopantothenate--cysteine ligase